MKDCRALRDIMIVYDKGQKGLDPPLEVPDDTTVTTTYKVNKFRPKSRHFLELSLCPSVWMFLQKSIRDLKCAQWPSSSSLPSNLSEPQLLALNQLKTQTQLDIKPSDKGGNIILMSHFQYQCMLFDILNNREWYCPIDPHVVASIENEFQGLCTQAHMKGLIDSDTLGYLVNLFPRIPTFYALLKVHKNLKTGEWRFPCIGRYKSSANPRPCTI